MENVSIDKLHSIVKDQGVPFLCNRAHTPSNLFAAQRLRTLEEDNRSLNTVVQSFIEEFSQLRSSVSQTVSGS